MRGYRYNDIVDEEIKKLSAAVADLDIEMSQEIMEAIKKEL